MPCGQESRWIPEFNIPEGSPVEDAVTWTSYYVKPLEMEQRMRQVDPSACSLLPLTTYPLPSISQFVDPNIGDEPVVDGPPEVIGGEVMY